MQVFIHRWTLLLRKVHLKTLFLSFLLPCYRFLKYNEVVGIEFGPDKNFAERLSCRPTGC